MSDTALAVGADGVLDVAAARRSWVKLTVSPAPGLREVAVSICNIEYGHLAHREDGCFVGWFDGCIPWALYAPIKLEGVWADDTAPIVLALKADECNVCEIGSMGTVDTPWPDAAGRSPRDVMRIADELAMSTFTSPLSTRPSPKPEDAATPLTPYRYVNVVRLLTDVFVGSPPSQRHGWGSRERLERFTGPDDPRFIALQEEHLGTLVMNDGVVRVPFIPTDVMIDEVPPYVPEEGCAALPTTARPTDEQRQTVIEDGKVRRKIVMSGWEFGHYVEIDELAPPLPLAVMIDGMAADHDAVRTTIDKLAEVAPDHIVARLRDVGFLPPPAT